MGGSSRGRRSDLTSVDCSGGGNGDASDVPILPPGCSAEPLPPLVVGGGVVQYPIPADSISVVGGEGHLTKLGVLAIAIVFLVLMVWLFLFARANSIRRMADRGGEGIDILLASVTASAGIGLIVW